MDVVDDDNDDMTLSDAFRKLYPSLTHYEARVKFSIIVYLFIFISFFTWAYARWFYFATGMKSGH